MANKIKSDQEGVANIQARFENILNITTVTFLPLGEDPDRYGGEPPCDKCSSWYPKGCGEFPCPPNSRLFVRDCPNDLKKQCQTYFCSSLLC